MHQEEGGSLEHQELFKSTEFAEFLRTLTFLTCQCRLVRRTSHKRVVLAVGSREAGVITRVALEGEPASVFTSKCGWRGHPRGRAGWKTRESAIPSHACAPSLAPAGIRSNIYSTAQPFDMITDMQSVHSGSACAQGTSTMCQE